MTFGDKLRNSGGDPLIGLAQWVARKVRNHDPMAELDAGRARYARVASKREAGKASVTMVTEGTESPVVLYELADGRMFELQVREVHPAAYAKAKRVAVGA